MNAMKSTLAAALLTVAAAAPAMAQLASASTPALGMGENYTAAARGYEAVSWNPALLAVSGAPKWTLALLPGRAIAGLDPVTLADLKEWENEVVPANVKQEWLSAIRQEGGEAGTGGGDVTWLAAHFGGFGLQASTSARAVSDISPGIAELLMFGNADDQGNAKEIDLSGSTLNLNAYSTVAASYGHHFGLGTPGRDMQVLAVGVTAKYTIGHLMALSQESTGAATTEPSVSLGFPMLHTPLGGEDDEFEANAGSGIGLDVGVAYETMNWTFGATVQNLVNTFAWDEDLLRYRAGTILFSADERRTEFEKLPVEEAPAALRALVDDMKFEPSFALGAMYRPDMSNLRVTADARFGGTTALATRPATHIGAGAEYRIASFLPVRAGAAYVKVDDENAGFQFGGGIGLDVGSVRMSFSGLRRSTDLGADNIFMLTLLSFGRM